MDIDNIAVDVDTLGITCHTIEEPEQVKPVLKSKYKFKILAVNIRTINKNFNNLLMTLKRLDILYDAIVLSECWLDESSVIPQICNYVEYHTSKIINQISVVVVYVRDVWNSKVRELPIDEANCLLINIPNIITLLGIYRRKFISSLGDLLRKFDTRSNLVVAGDMNINILLDTEENSFKKAKGHDLLLLLAEQGFPLLLPFQPGTRLVSIIFL